MGVVEFAHRIQHPAVDGLQTISNIGQRTPYDDAHRIVEIGLTELVLDIDRDDFTSLIRPQFRHKNVDQKSGAFYHEAAPMM